MMRRGAGALAVAALAVAGCAGPIRTGSPTEVPTARPTAAASVTPTVAPDAVRADLDRLLEALDRTHPDAFHGIEREAFAASLDAYAEAIPDMSPEEAVVELMRVVALLSRAGRDGHQFALPQPGHEGPVLPLRVYEFDEGLVITAAAPPNEGLTGATITAIGGVPVDEVLDALEPLVPRDGPATVPAFRPVFLLRTEVLRGLGIIGDGEVEIDYDHHGFLASATLTPMPFDAYVEWAGDFGMLRLPSVDRLPYLADPEPVTVRDLGDGVLYLRYRNVVSPSLTEARELVEAGGVARLILDLRQNPGGDNTTYGPLLRLVESFAAEHPGQLRVLIDRVTFSAASNLATEIEQRTDAVFIGEPMGGGLNFWDDVTQVRLHALPVPMQVGVSTRYWQFAAPDDPRLTIEPDIAVPASSEDFLNGRDPVLEAALAG
jgi:hypothetical protein